MATRNLDINIHHVTRIEGHGNIVVNAKNGILEKCEWQVPEAPRFFEAMVRGRHYSEIARITSRICGICSVGHTLASLKATEYALQINVSSQTRKLRSLLKIAENMDSHIVHLLFLAAPDLMGVKSVFPLVKTHPEVVKKALRLKRFAHELGSLIGGRTTHPTRAVPGGFTHLPALKDIRRIEKKLTNEALKDFLELLPTLAELIKKLPDFSHPTEYMALSCDTDYALYDGQVQTVMPDGKKERYPLERYLTYTNEYVVDNSTAKHTKNKLDSYMVGALARLNNNYDRLHPEAKKVAQSFGVKPLVFNPYFNNVAQAVEIVDCLFKAREMLNEIADSGLINEPLSKPKGLRPGYGVTEVPRGILFHYYQYDENDICLGGNYIIPTNQNHANIQRDFEKLVPELMAEGLDQKSIENQLEILVRAYDPCVSCSTHYLTVEWV